MNTVELRIESLDPMGQGVAKHDGQVYFVPKTLPDEKVRATILKKSKGVVFCRPARPEDILEKSPIRTNPDCPHYSKCNGCHFLHTGYEEEIELKTGIFEDFLNRRLHHDFPTPHVLTAPSRYGYRNRIQLHFDRKTNSLGFLNKQGIHEVNNCLLPEKNISETLSSLYRDNAWLEQVKSAKGHLELESRNGKVSLRENQPYAAEGFSQVNEAMNRVLRDQVTAALDSLPDNSLVLDLFGGSGNLTRDVEKHHEVITVDQYTGEEKSSRINMNLYEDNAVSSLCNALANRKPDCVILDPPRSGLKNLDEWLEALSPELLVYVSCSFQTQVRDLNKLSNDKIDIIAVKLIDLFPGTFHFESMVVARLNG